MVPLIVGKPHIGAQGDYGAGMRDALWPVLKKLPYAATV